MRLLLFVLAILLGSAAGAAAQSCSYNISALNFGNVNLLSGASADGQATVDISCTNTLNVSLSARLCLNLNAGSGGTSGGYRTMTNGANVLQYQLYRDSARTVPWGDTDVPALGSVNFLDFLLLPLTTVTTSRTIYARIIAGQQASPGGAYTSAFSGSQVRFNFATYTLSAPGCASVTQNPSHPTFTVQANVDRTCNVSAQNLSFGSRGILKTQTDSSSQVAVTCTAGLPFTIGLNGGLGNLAPTARKMIKGAQSITYGLYRDAARSQAWGDVTGLTSGGIGTGLSQNMIVYGRVPTQATPSPGAYSDTVVVTVTY